jgi:hypothetical protein
MPDDSLIEGMREALRGEYERAEDRHRGAAAALESDPVAPTAPKPADGPSVTGSPRRLEPRPADALEIASPPGIAREESAARGLLACLALLRTRR